jgi:hypothetical protein
VAFAPLTALPVNAVIIGANLIALLLTYAALRRLGLGPLMVALVLLWPPISGAIMSGNIEAGMFAAFVWLYWSRCTSGDGPPHAREPASSSRPALVDGVLAAFIPAAKISQGHAFVGLVRVRPRAALFGALACGATVLALVPALGIHTWVDWLQQTARATDPSWPLRGSSLTRDLPSTVTLLFAGATMLATRLVPRSRAGAWIGLLTVVGAPTLRMHYLMFAIPAMLELRREIALLAAILIATYTFQGL